MTRTQERLVWAGVAVAALALGTGIGTVSGGRGRELDEAARTAGRLRVERSDNGRDAAGSHPRGGRLIRDEKELKIMADRALSTPSRTERYHRVMQILDQTTAQNWKLLWEEYIGQTLRDGRIHENEWSLFMNRVGEVAGPEAMEYFTHHGQNEHKFNRSQVLAGWAASHPESAFAWLKSQPREDSGEFWNALMSGAATKDAALALIWMDQVPADAVRPVARTTVDGMIQSEGMANTIAAVRKLVDQVPAGAEMPPHLRALYQELEQRAGRVNWLGEAFPNLYPGAPDLGSLREAFQADQ